MAGEPKRMRPVIIIPPQVMSDEDIERLRDNFLCVVVATDPSKVKFLDPIPAAAQRTVVENAAIQLSRRILSFEERLPLNRSDLAKIYVDLLVRGTPLDPHPSKEEREQEIFDQAKADELRRLAREEAKAERAAKKAALATTA